MLIGIDASRAVAAELTGTEHYSLRVIEALLEIGAAHRFRLYAPREPSLATAERLSAGEWRIIPLPRLWTHLRLSLELLQNPPDALFVPAHVLPLVHRRRGVVTLHDLGYLHYPGAHTLWQRLYLDWSTRWSARVARRVIVDSCATRNDLIAAYNTAARKVVVAHPAGRDLHLLGNPSDDLSPLARWGLGTGFVLAVGTLQPRKNLIVLLEAFARLIGEGRLPAEARLVLAGRPGWLSDAILAHANASDLRGRVIVTGYVSDRELAALYRQAQVLAFPSLYEGFGLPVLEAMQCGLPVICANTSSLPEVAGDAALLVPPDDVAGWQSALERVYHEPELVRGLVERGLRQAERFSWRRCARTILDVIEELG